MTPAEKLYNTIKEILILRDGYNFLRLSKENQNKKILEYFELYRDQAKKETT